MSAEPTRRGLGRGLSVLLGDVEREQPLRAESRPAGVQTIAVAAIHPHPAQPRRHFDPDALDELAQSIAARGMIQPILVRPHGGGYQIVAGERRWRAAQRAHLHEVPVIVRDFDESATLEVALIENIQRADLSAIEEADAYARLIEEFGHSHEELGQLVQKSRSHVANLLRLRDLPASLRALVAEGALGMGHARALLTAPDAITLGRRVVEEGLSVRETERLARAAKPVRPTGSGKRTSDREEAIDADIAALERQIGDIIGLKVTIVHGKAGGQVTLTYSSLDQLDLICQRLSGETF